MRLWTLRVEWVDSQVIGGSWESVRDLLKRRKTVLCRSVGFVLADDEDGIVLAASINGRNAAGITIIPRQSITSIRRIR